MAKQTLALKFKKLNDKAIIPSYQTTGAAGMDISALLDEPLRINPGRRNVVPTGISAEIPDGYELQLRPRSGLAVKGLTVLNSPGTIDSDYRGEIKVILINHGLEHFMVESGMRIGQLVLAKVDRLPIEEVADLSETDRGEGGFGSTGV